MLEYDAKANVLFAATDVGVFDHKDGDSAWYKISVGLPNVPVLDVKLSGDGKYLFAATFGRSIWKLNLSTDATDGGGAGGVACRPRSALTLGTPGAFGAFTPGVDKDYAATHDRERDLDGGRRDAERHRPVRERPRPPRQRHVLAAVARCRPRRRARPAPGGAVRAGERDAADAADVQRPGQQRPGDDRVQRSTSAPNDALRTGSYSKTLTFTLSTDEPVSLLLGT